MALDDLDLEFEDEEEEKKKKNDALLPDVDLQFQMQENELKSKPPRPLNPQTPQQPMAQVKNIDEARAAQPMKRPTPTAPVSPIARSGSDVVAPRSLGATALKSSSRPLLEGQENVESEEILELRERTRKAEFNADVKVQVAEFKVEILGELLGDIKLMDHQINQLLIRINAKHPDMKQEVLMIKKILADFTAKKRK